MPFDPSALINRDTWSATVENLRRLLKLQVDGGDLRELPGGGYAFRLASAVKKRVYPFQVNKAGDGVIRVQNGVVFCAGKAFPFPSQSWAVGNADWVLYARVQLSFTTSASGAPLVDPWNCYPNTTTGAGLPIVSLGLGVLSQAILGTEAEVKYKTAGLPEIEATDGDVRWPIATQQNGVIIQHVKNHLMFRIRPNGRLSTATGYPDVETATL